jgi:hypothetical protein
METIPVIVEETDEPQSGTLGGVLTPRSRTKEIDTGKLRQSISRLSEQISGIFADIKKVGDFQLKQIQLSVEITAEGGVALVGIANAKAGAKGAITLTFAEPTSTE